MIFSCDILFSNSGFRAGVGVGGGGVGGDLLQKYSWTCHLFVFIDILVFFDICQ